jgi:hypothetical protein
MLLKLAEKQFLCCSNSSSLQCVSSREIKQQGNHTAERSWQDGNESTEARGKMDLSDAKYRPMLNSSPCFCEMSKR